MLALITNQRPTVQRDDPVPASRRQTIDWDAYLEARPPRSRSGPARRCVRTSGERWTTCSPAIQEHDRGKMIMACGTGKTIHSRSWPPS